MAVILCIEPINNADTLNKSAASSWPGSKYQAGKTFQVSRLTLERDERPCQHQLFENFKWLRHDMEKDSVLCHY